MDPQTMAQLLAGTGGGISTLQPLQQSPPQQQVQALQNVLQGPPGTQQQQGQGMGLMGMLGNPQGLLSFLERGLPTQFPKDLESPLLSGLTTGHWGLGKMSPITMLTGGGS